MTVKLAIAQVIGLSIGALGFQHFDCFDTHGDVKGFAITGTPFFSSLIEGYKIDGNRIIEGDLPSRTIAEAPEAPAACFSDGGKIPMGGKEYKLASCWNKPSEETVVQLCVYLCTTVPGCAAGSVGKLKDVKECYLHGQGALVDNGNNCAYDSYRCLGTIGRQAGSSLGFICPGEPLPRKSLNKNVGTRVDPSTLNKGWVIGQVLRIDFGGAQDCTSATADVIEAVKNLWSAESAEVMCPSKDEGPGVHINYWVTVKPGLLRQAMARKFDVTYCGETVNSPACLTDNIVSVAVSKMPGAPTLLQASLSTWTLDVKGTKYGAKKAVFTEFPTCFNDAGDFSGFKIHDDIMVMQFVGVQTLPEQHTPIDGYQFFASMRSKDDWYPVPLGCFRDTTGVGTPSNPALLKGGKHFELLGDDCLEERTQQEMLLVCLTICMHLDFGGQFSLDARCTGVNYDEHGQKGHCHLISHWGITLFESATCRQSGGVDRIGMCMLDVYAQQFFTGSDLCEEKFLVPNPPCGNMNYVGVMCHFDPIVCRDIGWGWDGWDDELQKQVKKGTSKKLCKVCEAGRYSSWRVKPWLDNRISHPEDSPEGVNFCDLCLEGRYCETLTGCGWDSDPLTCPERCSLGSYCPPGSLKPLKCQSHQYQDETGQGQCKDCPTGAGVSEENDDVSDCVCPAGTRRVSIASQTDASIPNPCTPCDEGMDCDWAKPQEVATYIDRLEKNQSRLAQINIKSHSQTQPFTLKGYHSLHGEGTIVYKCFNGQDRCPGGPPGTCSPHRHGEGCSRCETNYAPDRSGGCLKCEGADNWLILIILLVFSVVLFISYYFNRDIIDQCVTPKLALGTAASVSVTAIQMVSVVRFVTIEWPAQSARLMEAMSTAAFHFDYVKIGCSDLSAPDSKYWASVLVIYIACFILVIFYFTTNALGKVGLPGRWVWLLSSSINFGGQICVCFFTTLSIVTITPFICPKHPNGRRSVSTYPEVFCDSAEHNSMVVGGVVSFLFLIAFYGAVVFGAWKAPLLVYTMKEETFSRTFRFMFNKFHVGRWYWLCVLLPRGVLMALTPVVAPDDARAQMLLLSIILGAYSAMTALLKPWRVPLISTFDCTIMVTLVAVLFASSAFVRVDVEARELYDGIAIGGVTFIFVACFVNLVMSAVNMCVEGRDGKLHAYMLCRRKQPHSAGLVKELVETMGDFSSTHKDRTAELEGVLLKWDVNDILTLTDTFTMMASYGMLPGKGQVTTRLSVHRLQGGELAPNPAQDTNM